MVSLELIIQVWLLRNGQVVPPLPLVFLLYFSFTICSVCLYSFSFFFFLLLFLFLAQRFLMSEDLRRKRDIKS